MRTSKGLAIGIGAASMFALALAAAPAAAADGTDQVEAFRSRHAEILAAITGGQYAHLSDGQQREVKYNLQVIEHQLAQYGSVEAMPVRVRVRLFNRQDTINKVLTGMQVAQREICDREHRTGTRNGGTMCASEAERRLRREEDQARLRRLQRAPMPNGVGGGAGVLNTDG